MSLRSDAAALQGDLADLRHDLHQIPEIGLDLPRTQERVLAALHPLPLEVTTGTGLTSITAVLRGGKPGPVVLLRGDMDALPVTESPGEHFVSRHDGAMHACGHDLHTAGLVGAAQLLAARRESLAGDIVFMFQPGEEGFDGAAHMIAEGVLEAAGRPVDDAYGLHVMSSVLAAWRVRVPPRPADGRVRRPVRPGDRRRRSRLPAARRARPDPGRGEMVTALQTMVTRRFDVFEPVVLTVGVFHAGTKRNIIPDEAYFEATVRTFNAEIRAQVGAYAIQLCESIAAAYGLKVEARYEQEYPVTVNDAAEHDFVAASIAEVFGPKRFFEMPTPVTGSEDFSRVLAEVPGSYLFLGACETDDPVTAASNHSPRATFDDSVLGDGAALLAELAVRRLV